MRVRAKLSRVLTTNNKTCILEFETPLSSALDGIENLQDIDLTIVKHRNRRSLDANAYAWVLITQLAEKMNLTKTEVYQSAISNIPGTSDVVCVKGDAACSLMTNWGKQGLGWFCKQLPSKIDGCVNVELFYGSSCYNTKQMSDLINALVIECKEFGIETLDDLRTQQLIDDYAKSQEQAEAR
jgi:hypothetical protein